MIALAVLRCCLIGVYTERIYMSFFTYENEENKAKLETYEWDNTWIEQTNRSESKRVLYIGDSISCGVRKLATEQSHEEYLFDGFGSSKALDNPYLFDSIRLFAAQEPRQDAILFNNGLHGWHLNDEEEYKYHYERAIQFLMQEFKDIPVFLVLTTSVQNETRENRVKIRNSVLKELAKKYGLPVIDLYTISVEYAELRSPDGVHYLREGYIKFAEQILNDITKC